MKMALDMTRAELRADILEITTSVVATVVKESESRLRRMIDEDLIAISNRIDNLSRRMKRGFTKIDVRFEQVDTRFEQVDARFEQVDARFDRMDGRLDQMDVRFDLMDSRFDRMDAKFERADHRGIETLALLKGHVMDSSTHRA